MDLRKNVEFLLKKHGKQKKDLSEYLSISQGNLNRTLMGTSTINENKIAEFFSLTREELINNDYSFQLGGNRGNEDVGKDEALIQLIDNNTRLTESMQVLIETNRKLSDRILELTDSSKQSIAGTA